MKVIVAGGGIGGLALANGLVARGIETVVLERDEDLSATGGYKLHLGPRACSALRDLLGDAVWRSIRDSGVADAQFALAVRDHRGRLILTTRESEGESLDIDRLSLRLLLAGGLREQLRLGVATSVYRETRDGVAVQLQDGCLVRGDLLVIAEGSNSRLIRILAGGPTSSSVGLVGVAGRASSSDSPPQLLDLLSQSQMLAVGPGGVGLFASWHRPPVGQDLVIWGMVAVANRLPAGVTKQAGMGLAQIASKLLRSESWNPWLADLPLRSVANSVAAFPLVAADPDAIGKWHSARVTAIGDAAHAMPPTGGQGAATAILDAADLASRLDSAVHGQLSPAEALRGNLDHLRPDAARAVRESLQPVRWITFGASPAGRALLRSALPAAATVAGIIRRLPVRS